MEIKIKSQGKLIDATIEVVDGVMIVSPKEEEFEPKDGDVVYSGGFSDFVFIYKDNLTAEAYYYVSLYLKDNEIELPDGGHIGYVSELRPATEEEKKKLFDKLAEEGFEFDFEKKELVKLKWKPKYYEFYWCPSWMYSDGVVPYRSRWTDSKTDNIYQSKCWVFRTEEECQKFCDKLNQQFQKLNHD